MSELDRPTKAEVTAGPEGAIADAPVNRTGMFGVTGSGDTSGFGGLIRPPNWLH